MCSVEPRTQGSLKNLMEIGKGATKGEVKYSVEICKIMYG